MLSAASTIDISPTPSRARVPSMPLVCDLLLEGGRGDGKTYAAIPEVFRRAERRGALPRTLITRRAQGALCKLKQSFAAC